MKTDIKHSVVRLFIAQWQIAVVSAHVTGVTAKMNVTVSAIVVDVVYILD